MRTDRACLPFSGVCPSSPASSSFLYVLSVQPTLQRDRVGRHQRPPDGNETVTWFCASEHFTATKGIDHEASSHSSSHRYGRRHRLAVRIRRFRRDTPPSAHVWSPRLHLCKDDGVFRGAQPLGHARWHVRDGYDHDDFARCLTVLGMTGPSNKECFWHLHRFHASGFTTWSEAVRCNVG